MGSNSKESRLAQKVYWERKLDARLSALNSRGLEPGRIAKDSGVRKMRAEIRRAEARLQVIESLGKKAEEMAKAKAKKAAEAKKKKTKKAKDAESKPEMSKRQQKKKSKKRKEGKRQG
jgi:hypothetical protein